MNGIIIVDKPLHKTSFDVIRDLRKQYNIRKMGHIGTLDPLATGVLPILVGEATKLSDYLMEHDKEYIATLCFGEKRDTGDGEGEVISKAELPCYNQDEVVEVLESFLGESMQIPPMYSAIKVNGKKLYELARSGQTVERTPRKIRIDEIGLLNMTNESEENTTLIKKCTNKEKTQSNIERNTNNRIAEISFRVVCSKGTYIRVLCEDIAERLGTTGYMKALRRTRVGEFKIENCGQFVEMKNILKVPNVDINDLAVNNVKIEAILKKLINGVEIKINQGDGLVNLYNNGKFIGIGQVQSGYLKRKIIIENSIKSN